MGKFADNSTYTCVDKCPSTPSYYGYQEKCLESCPEGFYADDITRLCVPSIYCNDTVDGKPTYGDQTVRKCVPVCPFNYYADTRASQKLCVMMCDEGLYADDLTKQCVVKCP